jgi:hypothetical protein
MCGRQLGICLTAAAAAAAPLPACSPLACLQEDNDAYLSAEEREEGEEDEQGSDDDDDGYTDDLGGTTSGGGLSAHGTFASLPSMRDMADGRQRPRASSGGRSRTLHMHRCTPACHCACIVPAVALWPDLCAPACLCLCAAGLSVVPTLDSDAEVTRSMHSMTIEQQSPRLGALAARRAHGTHGLPAAPQAPHCFACC